MTHLLHTVILTSDPGVRRFIHAIVLQRSMRRKCLRLALDYSKLVRRFWCTECYDELFSDDPAGVTPLYDIIRGVQSLAVCARSQYLLYDALSSLHNHAEDWTCRRLTFAGGFWRWNPLISTPEGLACLGQVTHLDLWIDGNYGHSLAAADCGIPKYLKHVPLHLMPSLTHLAFAIMCEPLQVPNPEDCKRWIVERNPSYRDIVSRIDIRPVVIKSSELIWELAYLQGRN
jgi:hypothetical protein